MRIPLVALGATLALAVSRPLPARSCGAFFPPKTESNVALGAQRALFVLHEATVDLHIQPRAASNGTPFVWIVPVPAQPTLKLGDGAIFDALDGLTRPTVTLPMDDGGGGGGFGCGSADTAKAGGLGPVDNGVQHFGGGTLGGYTYDILGGTSAEALSTWLTDNGYAVPETFADAVAPYAGKLLFVAVKLTDPGSADVDLQPLIVSFARPFDSSLGYAAGMSKLSSPDVQPILLWVLADKRYRVANFGSAELDSVAKEMRKELEATSVGTYASAIATLTTAAGGRLAVTEFAKDLDQFETVPGVIDALTDASAHYLTRLYMEVPKASLEDLVITFAANAPDVEPTATAAAEAHQPMTAACVLVALAFVARRRRA